MYHSTQQGIGAVARRTDRGTRMPLTLSDQLAQIAQRVNAPQSLGYSFTESQRDVRALLAKVRQMQEALTRCADGAFVVEQRGELVNVAKQVLAPMEGL